jgi:hypothetical protein
MPRSGAGVFFVQNPVLIGALRSSSAINQNFSDMGSEITGTIPLTGTAGMTGPAPMADGTPALPGISFGSDTNSGFARLGANWIGWFGGGTLRKSIDADGLAALTGNANVAGALALTGAISVGDMAGLEEMDGAGFVVKDDSDLSLSLGDVVASFDIDGRSIFTGTLMPITTGVRADIRFPFACKITGIALAVDQVGSVVMDIWKTTLASFPPTVSNSICGAAKPTISMAASSIDTTLAGWTTTVAAGDCLRFNIDSASGVSRISVTLLAKRFAP